MTLEVWKPERALINMDEARPRGEHTYGQQTKRGACMSARWLRTSGGMRRPPASIFMITVQSAGGEVGPCYAAAAVAAAAACRR